MSKSTGIFIWTLLVFYSIVRLWWAMDDVIWEQKSEIKLLKSEIAMYSMSAMRAAAAEKPDA